MIKAALRRESPTYRMLHIAKHSYGASCIAAIVPAMIRCICRYRSKDDCKSDLAHYPTALARAQNELRDQIATQNCRLTKISMCAESVFLAEKPQRGSSPTAAFPVNLKFGGT